MRAKKKKIRSKNNSPDHNPINPTPYSDAIEIDEDILGGNIVHRDLVHVNIDQIKNKSDLATKEELTFSDRTGKGKHTNKV